MLHKFCLNECVKTTVQPKTKDELKYIIEDTIKKQGFNCDLNFIDTSAITDMTELFHRSYFNGDISKWDVSNVKYMNKMFAYSNFNKNISKWNMSNVNYYWDAFTNSSLENKPEYRPKFKD